MPIVAAPVLIANMKSVFVPHPLVPGPEFASMYGTHSTSTKRTMSYTAVAKAAVLELRRGVAPSDTTARATPANNAVYDNTHRNIDARAAWFVIADLFGHPVIPIMTKAWKQ